MVVSDGDESYETKLEKTQTKTYPRAEIYIIISNIQQITRGLGGHYSYEHRYIFWLNHGSVDRIARENIHHEKGSDVVPYTHRIHVYMWYILPT